jgi:hypothetical protein
VADTKFKPGVSGNPKGRAPGSTPAVKLRKAISKDIPNIITKLVDQALAGDVQAAKVLLDRVVPVLKPQSLPVAIPLSDTLSETGGNVWYRP